MAVAIVAPILPFPPEWMRLMPTMSRFETDIDGSHETDGKLASFPCPYGQYPRKGDQCHADVGDGL